MKEKAERERKLFEAARDYYTAKRSGVDGDTLADCWRSMVEALDGLGLNAAPAGAGREALSAAQQRVEAAIEGMDWEVDNPAGWHDLAERVREAISVLQEGAGLPGVDAAAEGAGGASVEAIIAAFLKSRPELTRRIPVYKKLHGTPDEPGLGMPGGPAWAAAAEAVQEAAERTPFDDAVDTWAGDPPAREWLIPRWLPAGRFGLISGRGEVGKSRLLLQVAAAIASGRPGAGLPGAEPAPVEPRGVVFASWEDEIQEFERRLWALERDGLVSRAAMGRRLAAVDMRGRGSLWAPRDSGGRHLLNAAELTEAGARLRATAERAEAALLVIDNAAGAFSGDENARSLVRAFVASWDAWGSETGCAVALISHPPKPKTAAAGEDDTYSGSTDWHASARWRWTLGRDATSREWGDSDGRGARKAARAVRAPRLTCAKSSYGSRAGLEVWLRPTDSGLGWTACSELEAASSEALAAGRPLKGGDDDGETPQYDEDGREWSGGG